MKWDERIGRNLKLRDLHILLSVAEWGSMGKAAAQLGISQPNISKALADMEHILGVRLFDRGPRGVEVTDYGRALLKRGIAAFDELKHGIRDIEFLADPTSGELRIGCVESLSSAILLPIIHRFMEQFPGVILHVSDLPAPAWELSDLRERKLDLILGRWVMPLPQSELGDDVNVEVLFDDRLIIAAGMQSRWAHRRRITLAELTDAPWVLPGPNTWNYIGMKEAFRARGLEMPKIRLVTGSLSLRSHLLANDQFVTAVAKSVADRYGLKVLPVDLPPLRWPIASITLKNRTLSPIVALFVEHVRKFSQSPARPSRGGATSANAKSPRSVLRENPGNLKLR